MKPYCANPKNVGKFGKPSSLVFRLTLFRSMVLLTVILSPLSPDILNQHVNSTNCNEAFKAQYKAYRAAYFGSPLTDQQTLDVELLSRLINSLKRGIKLPVWMS